MTKFALKPETAYTVWLVAWGVAGAALLWRRRAVLSRDTDGRAGWSADNATLAAYFGLYCGAILALTGLASGMARELATLAPGVEHFDHALIVGLYPAMLAALLLTVRRVLPDLAPQRPHRVTPKGPFGFTPSGLLLGFSGAMLVVYGTALGWNLALTVVKNAGLGDFTATQNLVRVIAEARDPRVILPFALGAVILAPVQEELFYRGGVFAALRARLPRSIAYAASGLIFATVHFNVFAFLPLAVMGAWLAWLYDTTADLRVPVTVHALFNLNTVVWAVLAPAATL